MTPAILAQVHAAAFDRDRPWSADEFADLLASPLVITVGDDRAFAMGRVIAPELEILTVACRRDMQRQGLGQACVLALLLAGQQKGAQTAFLEVADDNLAARHLYDRLGFEKVGVRRAYYDRTNGPAVDALVLSKALNA
ncbi:GNAT family N-acetyltransferase [Loktanella sp. TSTF-M6]|uniref:GNAT family N-acetyltransferase n=1 Tax=Loktanella gaetbuli TaxID=2881335 RepID=A0ABS8BX78_9RHOB|nr:GNAT family N-acetyltransferase [Loktanella gaetbuli]MCB5200325.1 GNAT family N-acetyltransferase [Loktanella gaetbuli]